MLRWIAWGATALLVTVVGGSYLFVQMRSPADQLEACLNGAIAGGDVGGPFTLVDETGATVTDADVITAPTLVYFGFTFCPDVCPLDNDRNAQALDLLDERGAEVNALFITVDPERDTPEYLAEFTSYYHDRMVGLTGSPEQIDAAAKAYRVYYNKVDSDDPAFYLVDHSTLTYLVTPDQGFITFFRRDLPPEEVADRVACVAELV